LAFVCCYNKGTVSVLHKYTLLFFVGFMSPLFAFAQVTPDCGVLSRNLKLGMSGGDVFVLQQLLNKNSATRVATSDAGSPGMETSYFGLKTMAAVVRFQNLYATEVLAPVGLSQGTGFVGAYTRQKLTTLCVVVPAASVVPVSLPTATTAAPAPSVVAAATLPTLATLPALTATATTSPLEALRQSTGVTPDGESVMNPLLTLATTEDKTPRLHRLSNYTVSPGDKLGVYGSGFSPTGNILHLGAFTIPDLKSTNGVIETVLASGVPLGKFDLWVSNANGETNRSFLIILERGTTPPVVKSYSPDRGSNGTLVTVVGEGFTPQNNDVYFGSQPTTNISSSDGKTLTFTLSMGLEGMPLGESGLSTTTIPVWFYIVNANGMSNNGTFTLTF
jgi:peptidoglycan hydrolase-like protein with peptidoglycan-binding domain